MPKILIVEDDLQIRSTYEAILKKAGHDVQSAVDGKQALERTTTFNPDLILLDMIMPNMDGLEFLKKYERDKKHNNVKVLVLSNSDIAQKLDKAYTLGASRYILKSSVTPKNLINLIDSLLST